MRILVFVLTLLVPCSVWARNLLIQGGTLIDGTGRPPIQNASVLIEGNRIRSISAGDSAPRNLPPDTEVINARGKFIIPGLIDSHVHYRPYMGEMFLAHGVTAVYDLGNPIYWQMAVKKGLNGGHIRGPRFYYCTGIAIDQGGSTQQSQGGAAAGRSLASVKTPQDAGAAVAALKGKTDCIKLNEDVPGDFFTAIAREAHAAGLTIISHSLNGADSASWGIDGMEHMTGIALSTIRSPEGKRAAEAMTIEAGHKNSLLYQWMDPDTFDDLIRDFVRRGVFINPTLDFEWKGVMERTGEFELEDTKLLYNPLLQYMPLDEKLVSLGQYHWEDGKSAIEREQFMKGYRRVQDFLLRFVKAGGKIYSGTDTAAANTPGLSLHHEMQLYIDAGLTPMQALMSSTKWAAEILRLDQQLGTIEQGKLADIVVLQADPLADIRNARLIDKLILNGELTDTAYHSDYEFPFPRYGAESKHLYNPPPRLRDVAPPVATQGATSKLRVVGQGFVPNSVVMLQGTPLATTWVSATELTASLSAKDTAHVGTFLLTVQSPKPGGGVSEQIEFIVDYPETK